MEIYTKKNLIIAIILISINLCFSKIDVKNKKSKGKCLFMLSDSSALNFHSLKRGIDQVK